MKDYGDIYFILIVGTLVFACLILFVIYFIISYKRRQELHRREKKDLESHFQQELLKAQLEIQEETFRHISQEIHDNITQALSLVKLNLGQADMASPQAAAPKITESLQLVREAIRDLRQLSHTLHPDYMMKKGLPGAIEYTLEHLRKVGTWTITFTCDGEEKILSPQKELILFRLAQESFNNIIRHAEASFIGVQLNYLPGWFTMTIEDDGKGFDSEPTLHDNDTGLGIRNMGNRARLIGADCAVKSRPGKGTIVSVHLPY